MRNVWIVTIILHWMCIPVFAYDFAGGTGEPNDPYQIATAEQLISIGDDPNLLDKHFVLINDIDLDPNLPGRKIFDRAVIAPVSISSSQYDGSPFLGYFNGQGHVVHHMKILGQDGLGLFGALESGAIVLNLGLEEVDINGSGNYIGSFVGWNDGTIVSSYHSGFIRGNDYVGGLVGWNAGIIVSCYNRGSVWGDFYVGGMVGRNVNTIKSSYNSSHVTGHGRNFYSKGGLVGSNGGRVNSSFFDIEVIGSLVSGFALSDEGAGLSTTEMQDISTYLDAGWDFVNEQINGSCNFWIIQEGEYPRLAVFYNMIPEVSQGAGTRMDPYIITDVNDLGLIWSRPVSYYQLATSMDLSKTTWTMAVVPWFAGVFDGNDNVISDLHIEGGNYLGLFGFCSPEASIVKLGVQADINSIDHYVGSLVAYNQGNITSCYSNGIVKGEDSTGGLVGENNSGRITASYSSNTVCGVGDPDNGSSIGGLVGINYSGFITASYSYGEVSGFNDNSSFDNCIGGLVGMNSSDGRITASYSSSTVSAEKSFIEDMAYRKNSSRIVSNYTPLTVVGSKFNSCMLGGLVGLNSGCIYSSYSDGTVGGEDAYVGGLVGWNDYGPITSCYSTSLVSGNDRYIGGLVGENAWGTSIQAAIAFCFWDIESSGLVESDGGVGLTTTEMHDIHTYLDVGWDFWEERANGTSDIWLMGNEGYPVLARCAGFNSVEPGGTGTLMDPYLITNASELGQVWYYPSAHYCLASNIDLMDISWNMAVVPFFCGSFDGKGYAISNLHVEGAGHLGLFGQLDSTADILNLTLENVDVNGIEDYIGGLAGENQGCITSSSSKGLVTGDLHYVGGLVGYNSGNITSSSSNSEVIGYLSVGGLVGYNSGSTSASYSNGKVGGGSYIGGLVGGNSGQISSCFSEGLTGEEDYSSTVGGLIGRNRGRVTSSYSHGKANGSYYVGGLVGENDSYISSSYSSNEVLGEKYVGGFVGVNEGTVTMSFWDILTSGHIGSDGGVGLTTSEMMNSDLLGLNGLSHDPNWILNPDRDYPRLAWEGALGTPIPDPEIDWISGNGTVDAPYYIVSVDQLVMLSKASLLSNKNFVLANSLDLSGLIWYQAVIPYFSGTFDGNGSVIKNLYIEGTGSLGLFGRVSSEASITNLGLQDVVVNGSSDIVGSLAGKNSGSIISSHSSGKVSGTFYVGSLVGSNLGSVTSSYSTGTVSGTSYYVGGLIGISNGDVNSCYSSCKVDGERYIGGLVGRNSGSIVLSHSSGKVEGEGSNVGGLVGWNYYGSIISCNSNGDVNGDSDVGGLVGRSNAVITWSCSSGSVYGDSCIGGLVGWCFDGSITSSYSSNTVNGNRIVGGLAGRNDGTINSSYSRSNVEGDSQVGGLVGYSHYSAILSSYCTGEVKGNAYTGGLVGNNSWGYQGGSIISTFWDVETSGLTESDGGTGLTTAEMQDVDSYLDVGWDFVDETDNGTDDLWWMPERDYPRLWWEAVE